MPWDHGLRVTAGAEGLAGHAGGTILREMADRPGLTAALKDALARNGRFPDVDGHVIPRAGFHVIPQVLAYTCFT
jgi:hypothetical protein